MENVPLYVSIIFMLTTAITIYIFYYATRRSKTILTVIVLWLALQSIVGISGFYTVTNTTPPRFFLAVVPPLLLIILLFATRGGRLFINGLDKKTLTLLHVIRIPVELVLWLLYMHKTIPQVMTLEGHNFDILSGVTAP